jgi:hypothetical protein
VQDDRETGAVLHVTVHGFQERLAKDAPVLAAKVSKHFCVELYELSRMDKASYGSEPRRAAAALSPPGRNAPRLGGGQRPG